MIERLQVPFIWPNKAGHRKGRCRSSRLEEDCLYASGYNVRFEARENILHRLACVGELARDDIAVSIHRNGGIERELMGEKMSCLSRA